MGRVVANEVRWENGSGWEGKRRKGELSDSKGRETGLADDPYWEKWDQLVVNGMYAEKLSQGMALSMESFQSSRQGLGSCRVGE